MPVRDGPSQPWIPPAIEELPCYFESPPDPPPRARRPALRPRPEPPPPQPSLPVGAGAEAYRLAGHFFRLIDVAGERLPVTLDMWWRTQSRNGTVAIDRRLVLERPCHDRGVWSVRGRMRRGVRSVPVELELWPHLDHWTKLTVTPGRRVRTSRRWFRRGNRLLDRFTSTLADTGAPA